jgi:hypothetical protein
VAETSRGNSPNPEPPALPIPVTAVAMPSSRLKYTKFKANGIQDVDDWLDQFSATLAANDEGDVENKKRLFHGLVEGEALRWFNTLTPAVKDNWDQLRRTFEEEFREIGTAAKVMALLGSIRVKSTDTLRSYTQKVQQLVGKLSVNPPANLQLEWFMSG